MDKNRLERELISRAADVFDLPADVISSLPHIELIGDCQLLMNSHQGILSYSREAVDINGGKLILRVRGENLELTAMTGCELRLRGRIPRNHRPRHTPDPAPHPRGIPKPHQPAQPD